MSNDLRYRSDPVAASKVEHRDRDIDLSDRLVPPWRDDAGVRAFLRERSGSHCEYYGYGKVALRDALGILSRHTDRPMSNVVLPSYIPSALLEPIRDAGYTPRFYRITRSLRANLPDVERLIDEETIALISINYFGFPTPDHDALVGFAADHDVALIEDNAHSALSMTDSGTLLGTRGDLGFTSFRKTIPVPNGAALFVWRDDLRDGPFPRSGISERVTTRDVRFLAKRAVDALRSDRPSPQDRTGALTDGRDLYGRDPHQIYEHAHQPMSKLTAALLDGLRPATIIDEKRSNYLEHERMFASLDGVRPVFERLPTGTCPQAYPVLVDEWEPLEARLDTDTNAIRRWPPLPVEVATDDRFSTARYLAEHLVPLSV